MGKKHLTSRGAKGKQAGEPAESIKGRLRGEISFKTSVNLEARAPNFPLQSLSTKPIKNESKRASRRGSAIGGSGADNPVQIEQPLLAKRDATSSENTATNRPKKLPATRPRSKNLPKIEIVELLSAPKHKPKRGQFSPSLCNLGKAESVVLIGEQEFEKTTNRVDSKKFQKTLAISRGNSRSKPNRLKIANSSQISFPQKAKISTIITEDNPPSNQPAPIKKPAPNSKHTKHARPRNLRKRYTKSGRPYKNPVLLRPRGVHTPVSRKYVKKYTISTGPPLQNIKYRTRAAKALLSEKVTEAKQKTVLRQVVENVEPTIESRNSIAETEAALPNDSQKLHAEDRKSNTAAEIKSIILNEQEEVTKMEITSTLSTNKGGQSSNQSEMGKGSAMDEEVRWLSPGAKIILTATTASEKASVAVESLPSPKREYLQSVSDSSSAGPAKPEAIKIESSDSSPSTSPKSVQPNAFRGALEICETSERVLSASACLPPTTAAVVERTRPDPKPPRTGTIPLYQQRNSAAWGQPVLWLRNSRGKSQQFPVFAEDKSAHPSPSALQSKLVSDVTYDEDQSSDEAIVSDGRQKARHFLLKNARNLMLAAYPHTPANPIAQAKALGEVHNALKDFK